MVRYRALLLIFCLACAVARTAPTQGSALESTFSQGSAALQAGKYAEAETRFRTVLEADPNNLPALGNLSVVYARTHRLADAIKLDHQALALDPGNADLLLNMGLAYMKQEQYATAVPVFQQLTVMQPTRPRPRILLATCYVLGNEPQKGWDLIQAQHLRSADPSVAYLEAVADARLNRLEDAQAIYSQLLGSEATRDQANFLLGQALHEGHRLPEAESAFEDILHHDPNFPGAHRELGKVYISMQHFPEAERELRSAIAQDPQDGSALYFLGAMLVQSAREAEGVPFLQRAEVLSPDAWAIPFYLGKAAYRAGHVSQAIALLQSAASRNDEEPQIFFLLAGALRSSGQAAEAKRAMDRVQALHSSARAAEEQALSKKIAGSR